MKYQLWGQVTLLSPIDSFNLNYLLKALLIESHWGLYLQHMNFELDKIHFKQMVMYHLEEPDHSH